MMKNLKLCFCAGLILILCSCDSGTPEPFVVVEPQPEPLAQANQAAVEQFVAQARYLEWDHQDALKLTGRRVDGQSYTPHQYLQIFTSEELASWRNGDLATIPDGAMIVAREYAIGDTGPGEMTRILVKVRDEAKSADGWFWSTIPVSGKTAATGSFGRSDCIGCHAAARDGLFTFLAQEPVTAWQPDEDHSMPSYRPDTRTRPQPLSAADPNFLSRFNLPDVARDEVVPFPPKHTDHVVLPKQPQSHGQMFSTADQCAACHNAVSGIPGMKPNMWLPSPYDNSETPIYGNYSPFGEWSASLNGLSGRDPVWHAQVESERFLRPQLADFTDNVCFSCHGPMATRQLQMDQGADQPFTIDMFYATGEDPHAKYGALARDGVSCMVCHAVAPEGLGEDPEVNLENPRAHMDPEQLGTYTAQFKTSDPFQLWGPYADDTRRDKTMENAMGLAVGQGDHMNQSKHCGSCHTVIVPALPVGYEGTNPSKDPEVKMAFEQTTYWEWRNSIFENEQTPQGIACQGCHMTPHQDEPIANIYDDQMPPAPGAIDPETRKLEAKNPYWRHTLLGINFFVFDMYGQFGDLLGTPLPDEKLPEGTSDHHMSARDWILNHAQKSALLPRVLGAREEAEHVNFDVAVYNLSGHKVPTGAGFRRVFIKFQVKDAQDEVLWSSGSSDEQGVLLAANGEALESEFTLDPGKSQPHYQIIEREDQVQIYETRSMDSLGKLQSTVLGIFEEYKDNRLLPLGWQTHGPNTYATHPLLPTPEGQEHDPDYLDDTAARGADQLTYRIPKSRIGDWARVEMTLYYQTIPPYYLADRFRLGRQNGELGRDTKRLAYITSRLNLKDTPAEGWKLELGDPVIFERGTKAKKGPSEAEIRTILKELYPTGWTAQK